VLRGMREAAIINNWLQMTDEGAFASIVTQVNTSSADEVDRLDAALLSGAATRWDLEPRRQLIKFTPLSRS
jgi:hypothetical protein